MVIRGHSERLLSEMERLRQELYGTYGEHYEAEGKKCSLISQDIYKASITLDKVIVNFLREKYSTH